MTNYDIEHVIKKEMSGDVKDAFVAIGNWQAPGKGLGQCWECGLLPGGLYFPSFSQCW